MIKLSERLYAAASLVGDSPSVADVGCDHGYLGMFLLEQGMTQYVYAMDVHKGPLERARDNAVSFGVSDRMEFILSDGLTTLKEPYAQTAVILGMGGALIIRIIEEAPAAVRGTLKQYVLGPQSEQWLFRRRLTELSLTVVDEKHVYEDGKYYPMLLAKPDESLKKEERQRYRLRSAAEYSYGRIGLERGNEVLRRHILREAELFSKLLKGQLPESRKRELKERYETAAEALDTYYKGEL
ncbi:MAG: SAM-dependent methyltransferase [Lachnospiraceae bacterium]|nr:SAM-dependent methyltransferase [Lachnospiraceae bacterium]